MRPILSRRSVLFAARRFNEARLSTHQEQSGESRPFIVGVRSDIAPSGEAIGLQIELSEQGPVNLCIRIEELKWLVSELLNVGCEAKRRQSSARPDPALPPTEAIPLPLAGIHIAKRDEDDQSFFFLDVGLAWLMFELSPKRLEQLAQTIRMLSAKSSSAPSSPARWD
jgi:hypothetical protein